MKAIVSVIIPTYGGNESLKRTLESVLQQDYCPLEVIVVDDNNPGTEQRSATETMMKEYENDKRVVYIQHEINKNGAAARNTGARASNGDYLAFLDDDDVFLPGKLRKQVAYLECYRKYDAVYCWRLESGKIIGSQMKGDLSASLLYLTFTPCTCSLMIRREAYFSINGFNESYRRHQDYEFLLRFFQRYEIGVVEEALIEIIGNGIDNQLKGEEAVVLKKKFLDTFSNNIDTIEYKHKDYKKRVYAKHYAPLLVKLLRYGNVRLALVTYFQEGRKGGGYFWIEFISQIIHILKKHITGDKKGKNIVK